MKANELMIGDWVKHAVTNEVLQVSEFTLNEDLEFQRYYVNGILVENVEPIPLTKEILNQNFDFHTIPSDGIHSKDEFWLLMEKPKRVWLHQYATSVFVQIDTKDQYGCECRLLQIKVLHVHELQHALKLCGIEKQIEL